MSADLLDLRGMFRSFDPHVTGYHVDIMDDHFVANLTWGPDFVNAFAHQTDHLLHVHLMVDNPFKWLDRLLLRPNSYFIFHYEALVSDRQIQQLCKEISNRQWKVGMAIKPQTNVESILHLLPYIDHILVMSVEPGFSGQKYISTTLNTCLSLAEHRGSHEASYEIGIDGGINASNIIPLQTLGIDICAISSAIFSEDDPVKAFQKLQFLIE